MSRKRATNHPNPRVDALLDLPHRFLLAPKAHAAFLKSLEAPAKPSAALKRLMARKGAWQR
jgi:uncharacterized protein (DUF1778 family)